MRSTLLVVGLAALTVGCSSVDRYRTSRSYPASARVESRGGQDRYVLCHKGRHTRTLPESAVRAHLDHGDRFGACSRRDREAARDRRERRGRNG